MEMPPFDVASMLNKEFQTREGWRDVFREAQELAQGLESILVRRKWDDTGGRISPTPPPPPWFDENSACVHHPPPQRGRGPSGKRLVWSHPGVFMYACTVF